MAKFKRNAPCWCGSGKKYKHCHYRREDVLEVKKSEAISSFEKLKDVRECLHPQVIDNSCSGKIIRAHTVQKEGQLSKIAREGHVYGYIFSLGTLFATGGLPKFELIGVNNASTFTGFCEKHDAEIFKDIETQPITLTPKQLFLLGYRAICMEFYKKKACLKTPDLMREFDKGKDLFAQIGIQQMANLLEKGYGMGCEDLELAKKEFDSVLVEESYDRINYAIIEFDKTPEVMTSGAFLIEIDFSGVKMQDLTQKDPLVPLTGVREKN